MAERVIIIGGGLAGLSAATALAPRGFKVTILESRNRLGGRAGSFQDAATGQLIDTCQHVSMGCCTNFAHFCRTVGIDKFLEKQPVLYFMTPDRRVSRFQSNRLPAPFHLAKSFARAHYLTIGEKLRVAWGLLKLKGANPDLDPPFYEWLLNHRQTPRTIQRFWSVVLTSALNESTERIGLRYARKVFVDGFMRDRRGFEVEIPKVPLGRFYGEELQSWLGQHGVTLRTQCGVKSLMLDGASVDHVELRNGERLTGDWFISAVPFNLLLDLLPRTVIQTNSCFRALEGLGNSPITSVHLWYDRSITNLPHVVLVDCVGQWVFNRGQIVPGEHYIQVVVSASRQFRGLGREEVERRIVTEMAGLFPEASASTLLRSRVVTEHAATFSAVPGVDGIRPAQSTPIPNLFLAGDWTATGWPATMEGAVRSGYLAAESLLRQTGQQETLVQLDA